MVAGVLAVLFVLTAAWAVKLAQLARSVDAYAAYWSQPRGEPGGLLYVALGDSAAQGIGASEPDKGYVGLIAQRLRDSTGGRAVQVVNLSTSGARIGDVLDTQLVALGSLPQTPDIVTVAIGGNDIRAYDQATFDDQTDQLTAALPPGTYVADAPYFMHGTWQRDAAQAADLLRASAVERGLHPVPLHHALKAQGWRAMLTQFAADWFHPNDRGHQVWADAFGLASRPPIHTDPPFTREPGRQDACASPSTLSTLAQFGPAQRAHRRARGAPGSSRGSRAVTRAERELLDVATPAASWTSPPNASRLGMPGGARHPESSSAWRAHPARSHSMINVRFSRDQRVPIDVEHAHERAFASLDDPGASSLGAVTWASAHLAAVQKALYPVATRTVPDGRVRVHAQLAVDHRLQQVLWKLDRRLTGDVHLSSLSVDVLEAEVRRTLQEHTAGERSLITKLEAVLEPKQRRALGVALARAMLRGPTRPHPYTRHGRFSSRLAFWFDGVLDRARDGLDSRIVPTPHRTGASRPMTRWGSYALGRPWDSS